MQTSPWARDILPLTKNTLISKSDIFFLLLTAFRNLKKISRLTNYQISS